MGLSSCQLAVGSCISCRAAAMPGSPLVLQGSSLLPFRVCAGFSRQRHIDRGFLLLQGAWLAQGMAGRGFGENGPAQPVESPGQYAGYPGRGWQDAGLQHAEPVGPAPHLQSGYQQSTHQLIALSSFEDAANKGKLGELIGQVVAERRELTPQNCYSMLHQAGQRQFQIPDYVFDYLCQQVAMAGNWTARSISQMLQCLKAQPTSQGTLNFLGALAPKIAALRTDDGFQPDQLVACFETPQLHAPSREGHVCLAALALKLQHCRQALDASQLATVVAACERHGPESAGARAVIGQVAARLPTHPDAVHTLLFNAQALSKVLLGLRGPLRAPEERPSSRLRRT